MKLLTSCKMTFQVLLGRWQHSLVAVKVLHEESTHHARSAMMRALRSEAELLQSLNHPYILRCYGASFNGESVRRNSHNMVPARLIE